MLLRNLGFGTFFTLTIFELEKSPPFTLVIAEIVKVIHRNYGILGTSIFQSLLFVAGVILLYFTKEQLRRSNLNEMFLNMGIQAILPGLGGDLGVMDPMSMNKNSDDQKDRISSIAIMIA